MKDERDLGVFDTLEKVWDTYPYGGCPGDYATISGEVVFWNDERRVWGDYGDDISSDKEQLIEGNLTVDKDLTIGGDIKGNVADFEKVVTEVLEVKNPPYALKTHKHNLSDVIGVEDGVVIPGKVENAKYADEAYDLDAISPVYDKVLSKNNDDKAAGLITFLKGFVAKGLIQADLGATFGKFITGILGSGACIKIDPLTEKSYLEVDELFVRVKSYFNEMIIETLSHVGGALILSPARMKCIKVDELENVYRCYFKNKEDEKIIHNQFVVNDQAKVKTDNYQSGTSYNATNKYYWRLITAIGADYIDLSKTDFDTGSDIPEEGDEICQLGNRTDPTRQNAIILSSYGPDAPSFKQYTGINSYSLEGKEVSVTSPEGNRYVGDFILNTGINIATQLKVLENLIKTEIQSVEHWINDEDNYLHNASFSLNLEDWLRESDLEVIAAEEPIVVNGEYYADATKIAEVVSYENKYMLHLKDSFVRQLNSNLDQPEKATIFYISFRYLCKTPGTLTCGFEKQGLYKTAPIATNLQTRIFEFSGTWDGTGDFLIQFTGDIYISLVTLTNRPLDDFKKEINSKIEQTATSIEATVKSIDNIAKKIEESGWLTEKDGTKIWASCTFSDGTKAMSLFNITPEGIFLSGSHINLKGLVTFESFSADFQTAYNQAFGNASMTAKDDVARQLGYTNYSQLVENAATTGKAIMIGGYLNLELIDVNTLLADKVISNKIVTALSGKRIEIDPQKNAILMYNENGHKISEISFIESSHSTSANPISMAIVSLYNLSADGDVIALSTLQAGNFNLESRQFEPDIYKVNVSPMGITFTKNGSITNSISNQS
ncbi:hypothetical protein [Bacteroides sp.]|uniref:hypothetical protein n=1 Tax=Bacteroides sp. TaxID=29523 RepID=UPI00261A5A96|nr:hypothetical protein [Bacteroides sp.]MDD3037148.1 hypothetical protein [Bacteroides sp.]